MIPASGNACPIPVFRYALEFWEADPYIVEIYYRNSLDQAERGLVDRVIASSRGGDKVVNTELREIDIEGRLDEQTRGFINRLSPGEYPWMVLRYPRITGINKILWSGPLSNTAVDIMLNSPAREDVALKLADNVTAVWVLLESGNRQKDRAALETLSNELSRLEQTLALPDLDLWMVSSQSGYHEKVSTINFDIVTVSRDDPKEEYFVQMLLNIEDDLEDFVSDPIVFPVYGRGIALWAIVGRGINQWNIREAAEFITGPCSCQAKLLNPGTDMLMTMDWDNVVESIADMSLANPLTGLGDFPGREAEVIRLLDEATVGRLGSLSGPEARREAEPGRVVYLDIFKDNEGQEGEVQSGEESHEGQSSGAVSPTVSPSGRSQGTPSEASDAAGSSSGSGIFSGVTDSLNAMDESLCFTSRSSDASLDYSGFSRDNEGGSENVYMADRRRMDPDENDQKNRNVLLSFALVFAGVIGAVLVLGLVFYWKRVK